MRAVAGFGSTPGNYFLKRGVATPPESLQRKIWPWIEGVLAAYATGKIANADLAGMQFLELLQELRVVILQDAAILIETSPGMSVWKHPVFSDADWPAFAGQVRQNEAVAEEPADIRIRGALPAIAEGLASLQTSLSGLLASGTSETRSALNGLRLFVGEKFTNMETQVAQGQKLQGLFLVPPEAVKTSYVESFLERMEPSLPSLRPKDGEALLPSSKTASGSLADPVVSASGRPSGAQLAAPTGCPEGCAAEPIGPVMESVAAVYQEWYWGLEKKGIEKGEKMLSVVELDRRWPRGQWRYTGALRTRWQNRKKLVLAIDEEAKRQSCMVEEVIVKLTRLPHSADKIVRLLKQQPLSALL